MTSAMRWSAQNTGTLDIKLARETGGFDDALVAADQRARQKADPRDRRRSAVCSWVVWLERQLMPAMRWSKPRSEPLAGLGRES
ncbi:hypothetical protein OV090_12080 [Nannocystis sp. RBIL2]|uniref:hypothetical protein n=1 Tax=Nannocystis sp. RBIL2 TaxID=2996788 RepID=UPI00226FB6DB|nr:hypothetical protein [Nannocystis sp. RBIL2]MCY1065508.1 hypothetical protein [Nannocystis sp. RBIL2]